MNINTLISNKNVNEIELSQPYIIAEIGVNHEGSIELARRLVREAKEAGADAVKFQTYKAEKIASKHSPAYWDITKEPTKSQFELFKKYDNFGTKEFEELKNYSDQLNIEFLSTPFDVESANYLNKLMNVFKISSSDITNLPFIEYICNFNKPIILSTGASYLYEIEQAVEVINKKNIPFALLHCVLNYPTKDKNANLGMIKELQKKFPANLIGYSDHTLPKNMKTIETAFLLGAKIIEKHFTHDKSLPGNDHYHAMDKNDLILFRKNCDKLIELFGKSNITSLPSEEPARKNARRSLVATRFIKKNSIITKKDITWKRPAHGISPVYFDELIGKKSLVDINEDEILKYYMFK